MNYVYVVHAKSSVSPLPQVIPDKRGNYERRKGGWKIIKLRTWYEYFGDGLEIDGYCKST